MGLFGRIFGNRETEGQRIRRARACIAADEPELVLWILVGIESTNTRDLVDLAREKIAERERKTARTEREAAAPPNYAVSDSDPVIENLRAGPFQEVADAGGSIIKLGGLRSGDGSISISFGADGSQRIGTSAGSIVLNAPVSDDDESKTLSIIAALGPDGPAWGCEALP